MQGTALASYNRAKKSKMVSKDALKVYRAILKFKKPATAKEIEQVAETNGLWRRLVDLERQGLVQFFTRRKCTITGRTVKAWKALHAEPKPFRKRD
jgi:predicted ArsR family transcriptional regulator